MKPEELIYCDFFLVFEVDGELLSTSGFMMLKETLPEFIAQIAEFTWVEASWRYEDKNKKAPSAEDFFAKQPPCFCHLDIKTGVMKNILTEEDYQAVRGQADQAQRQVAYFSSTLPFKQLNQAIRDRVKDVYKLDMPDLKAG